MKRIIAWILIVCIMLVCSGCAEPVRAGDMMTGISGKPLAVQPDMVQGNLAATDFGVQLLQKSYKPGQNTLLSPVSVLYALGMTANGAGGQTLSQMEQTLGLPVSELNQYLYKYTQQLHGDEDTVLKAANSIWFTENNQFVPKADFLQCNGDYYGADIYQLPFGEEAVKQVNNWVKTNTDGMISEILQDMPEGAVMYLVNALVFDALWQVPYEDYQVFDGEFTREDGVTQCAEFMDSQENGCFLQDDYATGFIKHYEGGQYAFAALLPREDVSVESYLKTLSGVHLQELLKNPKGGPLVVRIPKFEVEYDISMNEVLMDMGMEDAFSPIDADFSRLGDSQNGNIFISQVLHKTKISVTQRGTKAGAVTSVEMNTGSADLDKRQEVFLDRPFVYMLIDCRNNVPIFVGTMMDIEA